MSEIIKELKFFNSSWNFELDEVENFSYWNNAFSKEECETIIKIGKKKV